MTSVVAADAGTGDAGTAVLIPVKAFGEAKRRLSSALDPAARAALARRMAANVVAAAAPFTVAVVCDDDEVAAWAHEHGALVLHEPGRGLNGAVEAGVEQLAAAGFVRVVVAHADLPRARTFRWVAAFDGITIVPDRRNDGTNVLCLPTDAGFRFTYGSGSFARHHDEAVRIARAVRVAPDRLLGADVDLPSDLADLVRSEATDGVSLTTCR